jgi:hypothetical protein
MNYRIDISCKFHTKKLCNPQCLLKTLCHDSIIQKSVFHRDKLMTYLLVRATIILSCDSLSSEIPTYRSLSSLYKTHTHTSVLQNWNCYTIKWNDANCNAKITNWCERLVLCETIKNVHCKFYNETQQKQGHKVLWATVSPVGNE